MFEYCHRTLAEVIDNGRATNEFIRSADFTRWATEISHGLEYIHHNGHYHGNLMPLSIGIDYFEVVKISDFG
ncbi:hypothetical protein PENTCL1PPCAC_16669, partial [Pristionchus entomophagus]